MLLAQPAPINKLFNARPIARPVAWTKQTALNVIRKYLMDEAYPEEAESALDWLEDEYPRARDSVRRMRCYLLIEEFEYEERTTRCGSYFRQITLHL